MNCINCKNFEILEDDGQPVLACICGNYLEDFEFESECLDFIPNEKDDQEIAEDVEKGEIAHG